MDNNPPAPQPNPAPQGDSAQQSIAPPIDTSQIYPTPDVSGGQFATNEATPIKQGISLTEKLLAVLAIGIVLSMIIPGAAILFWPILIFGVLGVKSLWKDSRPQTENIGQNSGRSERPPVIKAAILLLKVIVGIALVYFIGMALIIVLFIMALSTGNVRMD